MAQPQLDTPIQYVKGVGPRRALQLSGLGIETLEDLLTYYPRRFDLRRQVQDIATIEDGQENATVAGTVTRVDFKKWGSKPYFLAEIDDGEGSLVLRWFFGGYLRDSIKPGIVLAVSGKVSSYKKKLQMINPSHQIIYEPDQTNLDKDELIPVYPAGEGLSSKIIGRIIRDVLPNCSNLFRPWFDKGYLSQRGLVDRQSAISAMHRPEDREQWNLARMRLAYDECFLMQLGIAIMRNRRISSPTHKLKFSDEIDRRIRARFPFSLTAAQDRVVSEIAADLVLSRPMNRLLQGDVGSGKTVVALYAALMAVAGNGQVAIMAPTEILARQHYRKICDYLSGSRVDIGLITGSQSAKERKVVHGRLESGDLHIAVGTHALLSEGVSFNKLALVIVDEQHKFGVAQRTVLRGKGYTPHYLVMTATPIPRTLAMTVFGDLDVSTIDEMPPGRGKTTTRLVNIESMDEVIEFVEEKLREKQQAFFVYPLVSPSPEMELKAAMEAYDELSAGVLGKYGTGLVHGRMSPAEKNDVMQKFSSGKINVLVASTVVEVGVDISSANVMVVSNAERFGLAQLHQLRGRVGRGVNDAHCFLVYGTKNPIARMRLDVMVETNDGFRIAEEDLRIRGPGELFSTRQHGMPEMKVVDLVEDLELLRKARRDAFEIIDEDPDLATPHFQQIRREVIRMYGDKLRLVTGA